MKLPHGKGENMIEIMGYYRRERDNSEYIYYVEDGEEHLTSGIHDWDNKNDKGRIKRYKEQLIKVDAINLDIMRERLKKSMPFRRITDFVNSQTK